MHDPDQFSQYVGTFLGVVDMANPKTPEDWRLATGALLSATILSAAEADKASGALDDDDAAAWTARRAPLIPFMMYALADSDNNLSVEAVTEALSLLCVNKCVQMAKKHPDRVSELNANLTRTFLSVIANVYGNVTVELLSPGAVTERKEVASMSMYNRLCDALNDEIQRAFPVNKDDDYGSDGPPYSEE